MTHGSYANELLAHHVPGSLADKAEGQERSVGQHNQLEHLDAAGTVVHKVSGLKHDREEAQAENTSLHQRMEPDSPADVLGA